MNLRPGRVRMTKMKPLVIRSLHSDDAAATAQIYFDAVHIGAAAVYTAAERNAWAPAVPDVKTWLDRLHRQHTWVAKINCDPVGFFTLNRSGYVDLAFVAPDWSRHGIGRALYEQVETRAKDMQLRQLNTQASRAARGFFERQGWTVIAPQMVERNGVSLENFRMVKFLTPRDG